MRSDFLSAGSRKILGYVMAGLTLMATALSGHAQELPSIELYAAELTGQSGPIPVYFDPRTERILLKLSEQEDPILHFVTLSSRGKWPLEFGTIRYDKPASLLQFRRSGNFVEVIEDNPDYLTRSDSINEKEDTDSLAAKVVATLTIVAVDGNTWLVDGTDFFMRDAYGTVEELTWVDKTAILNPASSGVEWPTPVDSKVTTDLDVRLVFDTTRSGQTLDDRSPGSTPLTVVQRHVFFRVPQGFQARPADKRLGFIPVIVGDVSEIPDSGNSSGWVQRWRLFDTENDQSVVQHPITFFLESAIPLEYRDAVSEGIDYWRRTMETIGLPSAVQVADLPLGADPLDLRYSAVFVWASRSQPLSSIANYAVDPRTGEIVKAVIQLDSHWPWVARNEYRSYRPALDSGSPSEREYVSKLVAWAAAHEAAHVIAGFSHTGHGETAVSFRRPRLTMSGVGVRIELDHIVPESPFSYDLWLTRYTYDPEASGNTAALQEIVARGRRAGLRHIEPSVALLLPQGVTRILNPDVLEEFREVMSVRSNLLAHFDDRALDPGEPRERLFERLVPVYFHHRFVLQAASRMLGGLHRVDSTDEFQPISSEEQWLALDAIIKALSPPWLAVPPEVVSLMPQAPTVISDLILRGETDDDSIYRFQTGDTAPIDIEVVPGLTFDPLPWARSLADMTLTYLLSPVRAARLNAQVIEDSSLPSLSEIVDRLISRTWAAPAAENPIAHRYQHVVQRELLKQLISLASTDAVAPDVRETVRDHLLLLRQSLNLVADAEPAEAQLIIDAMKDIDQLLTGERER